MKSLLRHARLLPAVIAVAGALLVVKVVGLVRDAHADNVTQTNAPTVESTPGSKDTADNSDSESSSSEVDVLTSLSRRRAALDAREKQLQTEKGLIDATEKRVDDKIANLKALQAQIQALLVQRDSVQQKQIESLVKTYASMKPRDAAKIFDSLAEDVLVAVAAQMKPDVLGAILGQMQTEAARSLTVKLANRLKPADPPPAPVQVASVAPVPTPSAPVSSAAPASTSPAPAAAASSPVAQPQPAASAPSTAKPDVAAQTPSAK